MDTSSKTGGKSSLSPVLLTQVIVSVVFVLLVLLTKLIGGAVFQTVKDSLHTAIEDDSLLTDISVRLYGTTTKTTTTVQPIVVDTTTQSTTTASMTAGTSYDGM